MIEEALESLLLEGRGLHSDIDKLGVGSGPGCVVGRYYLLFGRGTDDDLYYLAYAVAWYDGVP